MIFKDRVDAGLKLATLLQTKYREVVIVSLLRGGVIVGHEIAKTLKSCHYPLPVAKISAPNQPELAIGALCFDSTYLNKRIIESFRINRRDILAQITLARKKFLSYMERFDIKKTAFRKIKNKTVILVDDGIATGASIKAAHLYLKALKPKKIIVAAPVAPMDFLEKGFDEVVVFHKEKGLAAISKFYEEFPQVSDFEVKKLTSI